VRIYFGRRVNKEKVRRRITENAEQIIEIFFCKSRRSEERKREMTPIRKKEKERERWFMMTRDECN